MIYEFNGYKPVIHPSSFVHKEATIIGNVLIGKDVYIGPGASLRGDWGQITIEDGCVTGGRLGFQNQLTLIISVIFELITCFFSIISNNIWSTERSPVAFFIEIIFVINL